MVFSVARLVKIIYDLWTSPPEEGKMVNSQIETGEPVDPFDPVISMSYEGPSTNTSINYFDDVKSVYLAVHNTSLSEAIGVANFTVDENTTSSFLEIMSQPSYRENLFQQNILGEL